MKKLILLLIFISAAGYSQAQLKRDSLNGNNIRSYLYNTGIFNQDLSGSSKAGFEWPKGSGKTAIFTSGINAAAYVNGQLRMGVASYKGEYTPGYSANAQFFTDPRFKFYKIKRGDNHLNNPDWLNWGVMVSFGAPYVDVINSGHYEY